MNKIIGLLLFGLFTGVGAVSAQTDYCFQNDGLKLQTRATFTVTKNKIEGTFESGGYENTNSAETFDFTGTKIGNLLTISFAGKPPYQLPPRTKRIVWTLGKSSLQIPTFGKNYQTGKYTAYTATYQKCQEN